MKKVVLFALLGACLCLPLPATQVSLGGIGVAIGIGSAPQMVFLQNLTGSGCESATTYPLACPGLSFTNWTADVFYLLNGTTPTEDVYHPDPNPEILPNAELFTLYGSLSASDIVTKVIFTASFPQLGSDPVSFNIYDPGTTSNANFYPENPFTFEYVPTSGYQDATWDYTDLLVSNSETPGGGGAGSTPEPATLGMLAAGAAVIVTRRRFTH